MSILKVKDAHGNIIDIPAIKGDKGDKGEDGAIINLDQAYNPESENAQSGKAVAQALSRVKKIAFALAEDTKVGQMIITIGNFSSKTINTNMSFFNPRLLCNGVDICNPMTQDHFNDGANIKYNGCWNKRGYGTVVARNDGYLMFKDDITHNSWSCVRYFKNDIVLKAGIYELSVEYFGNIEQLPTMEVSFEGTTISTNAPTISTVRYEKFRDVNFEYALEKGHIYLFSATSDDEVHIRDKNGSAVLSGLKYGVIVCADRCICMGLNGEFSITNLNVFKNDKWDWTNGPYYITNFNEKGIDIWRI